MRTATPLLKSLIGVAEVTLFDDEAAFADASRDSAVGVVGTTRVALGVKIDRAAEIARVTKEMERYEAEITKARAQLDNQNFVARARPEVVDQFRKRVADFTATLSRLRDQRERLESST